ncbi:hypothetical protein [Nocardia sp. NBC_01009]|uniref:hypothetical protein n=1 Tax=Nocardia sp. NBC_01009 TaxID=2975996 RepID=UPI0038686842|nr:hypothetical protein OHA42_33295 [Nocardia sp. NBC_01009]
MTIRSGSGFGTRDDAAALTLIRAFDWPATRSKLRKNAVFSWVFLLVGLVCIPMTIVLVTLYDKPDTHGLSKLGSLAGRVSGVVAILGTVFGVVIVWMNFRRRKALRRHPWTSWRITYIRAGRHEWVTLLGHQGEGVSTLLLSTWPKDIGKFVDHKTHEIWFAGDPVKYGVISRRGGTDLGYAYVSRSRKPPQFTFNVPAVSDARTPHGQDFDLTRDRHGHVLIKPAAGAAEDVIRHGSKGDARYPSPRALRRVLAFATDWTLHFGSAAAILVLGRGHIAAVGGVAVGVWLTTSFADRVLVQGALHTTVGKALFGLCVIRPDDGTFPSYGRLTKVWFMDLYFSLILPLSLLGGDGPSPDNLSDYFLPAVRRRDLTVSTALR